MLFHHVATGLSTVWIVTVAVAEVDGSGKLRARFVYATLGHSPDAVVTFAASGAISGVYLLVHDAVGSPVLTVSADGGTAVEVVDYDAWGVAAVAAGGSSVHPFGFASGLVATGSPGRVRGIPTSSALPTGKPFRQTALSTTRA